MDHEQGKEKEETVEDPVDEESIKEAFEILKSALTRSS